MDDSLDQALRYFVYYWQTKKNHSFGSKDHREHLQDAYKDFVDAVPPTHDPHKLLAEWEATFHDLEVKYHHQGG